MKEVRSLLSYPSKHNEAPFGLFSVLTFDLPMLAMRGLDAGNVIRVKIPPRLTYAGLRLRQTSKQWFSIVLLKQV